MDGRTRRGGFLASGRIVVAVLWVVATILVGDQLSSGQRLAAPVALSWIAGLLYIGGLIWWLSRRPPRAEALPDLPPRQGRQMGYQATLWAIILVILLAFALGIVAHPILVILLALTGISAYLLFQRWRQVGRRMIAVSLGVGMGSILLTLATRGLDPFMLAYLAMTPFLSLGGMLLVKETGFGAVRLVGDNWPRALRSAGQGILLAVPPALLNTLGGAWRGDAEIQQPWDPVYALVPGTVEEVWARLLLTTLLYALLRRASNDRPRRAVAAAILIAALTHGLAHLPTYAILSPAALGAIASSLLYGVPMGFLFAKQDLEAAAGYHTFIDLVRFSAAYFWL